MQCTGFFGKREDRSERHSVKPHAIELHGSPSEFITEFIRNLNVTFSIVNMCRLKWPSRSQHGCILAVLVYSELSCVDIWCAGCVFAVDALLWASWCHALAAGMAYVRHARFWVSPRVVFYYYQYFGYYIGSCGLADGGRQVESEFSCACLSTIRHCGYVAV